MITRTRRPSLRRRLWLPAVAVAFLGYFGFHAFNGSYGLWALETMQEDKIRLRAELDGLRKERAELDLRVAHLRPESLDADIVDIEARAALNMLRADEVVISFGASQHFAQ